MKNSYSNIFTFDKKTLKKAVNILIKRNVVGLPTETVYGVGGNAYSEISVRKIFQLKGRPKTNPLIIHYYSFNDVLKDVCINKYFIKLYKRFCPGPITFILKKKNNSRINPISLARLETVAVRFPKHRVIRAVLKNINFPLAMPSANKSKKVSPVNATDVFEEFQKRIPLIIDGGTAKVGIESTVLDLTSYPKILRPGRIYKNLIEKTLKLKIKDNKQKRIFRSPGMLKKHYYPGIPVLINQKKHDGKSAFIYLGKEYENKKNFFSLSKNKNLDIAASNLYKILRLIKRKGYKKIQISKIPNTGSGIAINDRIERASN